MTNNIVCSSCGAAGHIARDCRQKRPGQGGPPQPGDKAKIDEEYMSLMAELGEGPPPPGTAGANGTVSTMPKKTVPNISMFEQQMTPRSIMPPPMPTPPMPNPMLAMNPMNGMAPPPWVTAANMTWQPGPPGIMPPPPPPGASSPPQMSMPWLSANTQPPPPGAATNSTVTQPWAATQFTWPAATSACVAPPPPPGIDMSSLLSAPPPPPPS